MQQQFSSVLGARAFRMLGATLALIMTGQLRAQCPGEGCCYEPNAGPGCITTGCCELVCAVEPLCCSEAWDAECVGLAIEVCRGSCLGDTNGDLTVDVEDLVNVIVAWDTQDAFADVDADCVVAVSDLIEVILNWGSPCEPPAMGACCLPNGQCADRTLADCVAADGSFEGEGTACGDVTCPQPGACCFDDGSCADTTDVECAANGGVFQGSGSACSDVTCPQPGACCFDDGSCSDGTDVDCAAAGGTFQGVGSTCADTSCPQPGACCFTDGTCSDGFDVDCAAAGGTFQGVGSLCASIACPQPGACCLPDGTCTRRVRHRVRLGRRCVPGTELDMLEGRVPAAGSLLPPRRHLHRRRLRHRLR